MSCYTKVVKLLKVLLIVATITYLNLAYRHFYHFLGTTHLPSPTTQSSITLTNPKATGSLKLVTLGDSLTSGVGVTSVEQTYPYLLAQDLTAHHGQVELTNLGIPGATINTVLTQELAQEQTKKPDLVLILIGINDIHDFKTTGYFKQKYLDLVNSLTGAKIVLVSIPYLGEKSILLPPYNLLNDLRVRQFNSVIKDVASEKQLTYVDLYTPAKAKFDQDSSYYASDLFHPSASGYKIFASIIDASWNQ